MNTKDYIKQNEGCRTKPYHDTRGFLTIGYGRNLTINGISNAEAEIMLDNDFHNALQTAFALPYFHLLNEARQAAIVDMVFNLGARGFQKFVKLNKALSVQDYNQAAIEILNSAWAGQVKTRAQNCAQMIQTGEFIN